jgi:hypothetical protein
MTPPRIASTLATVPASSRVKIRPLHTIRSADGEVVRWPGAAPDKVAAWADPPIAAPPAAAMPAAAPVTAPVLSRARRDTPVPARLAFMSLSLSICLSTSVGV